MWLLRRCLLVAGHRFDLESSNHVCFSWLLDLSANGSFPWLLNRLGDCPFYSWRQTGETRGLATGRVGFAVYSDGVGADVYIER
jgi:hypothetical protein